MSGGPNEFTKRALTGAVYVALTLGAAIAGPWTTFMLFLPVCVIGAREWHLLYHGPGSSGSSQTTSAVLAGVAYVGWSFAAVALDIRFVHAAAITLCLLVVAGLGLMRAKALNPAQAFAGHMATTTYIAGSFACAVALVDQHEHLFLGFMFLLWTSDTGAYLVGRSIGRTKLMPAVSPGKTWEGLAGGVALTMLVGYFLGSAWNELSINQWLIAAATVAITATIGDLLESAFKRAQGVKDSGTLLPGHGGILDRFDGFLLAAPAMLVIVRFYH